MEDGEESHSADVVRSNRPRSTSPNTEANQWVQNILDLAAIRMNEIESSGKSTIMNTAASNDDSQQQQLKEPPQQKNWLRRIGARISGLLGFGVQ